MVGNSQKGAVNVILTECVITDGDVSLGDVIKRATSAVGVRSCGSCEQRAPALNRRLLFSSRIPR